jgi:hypothetical protein
MMDITRLADHWRGIAKFRTVEAKGVLLSCADELEQAWHDHAHDAAWEDGCRICDIERAEVDAGEAGPL